MFRATLRSMALALFGLLTGLAPAQDRPAVRIPKVEYRGGIYYLVLDGATPYDRGYQHGAALEFAIKKALRQFAAWIRVQAHNPDPRAMMRDFAADTPHLAAVQQRVPELFEELRGVADGAGVDLRELFVYQSFDEFFLYLYKSGALAGRPDGHCTTAGIYGRTDLPNYVGHNNDIPIYHEELVTVLHIRPPGSDLQILQSTFAGQIGQNGVNSHGVAVGINTLADLPGSNGVPVSFHVRRILGCRDRNEAVKYLQSTQFATAMNYMIGDREKTISVETWETNAVVLDVYEGSYAVHTNHTLQEDAPVTFKMDSASGGGSYGFTHERLKLGLELISQNRGTAALADFQALFKTKPILVHPGKPTGRTLMSMIAEVPQSGAPALYLSPDSPNRFDYVRFDF